MTFQWFIKQNNERKLLCIFIHWLIAPQGILQKYSPIILHSPFLIVYVRNSYEHIIVLLNVLHGDTCQCVGTATPGLTLLFISLIFFFLQTFSFLLIKQLVQGNSRNYTTLHGWHPYGELSRTISLSLNDPDIFRLDQLE